MKEVGKIKDGKATFLSITLDIDIETGNINSNIDYDTRVLDKSKEVKLKEIVTKFVNEIDNNCALEESEDKQ